MPKGIPAPVEQRLYGNTKKTDNDCWEYQGAINNAGYAFIRDGKGMRTAHRVSYELEHDVELPSTTWIGHTCYNYRCVNPAHLYASNRMGVVNNMNTNKRYSTVPRRTGPINKGTCEHCGTIMAVTLLARYHNDNCKNKPIA